MLIRKHQSTLLFVDVQERLLPHISDGERLLANCIWLARIAGRVGVPIIASEQYPQGLGRTVPPLREWITAEAVVEKVHFSCVTDGCLKDHPAYARQQMVVAGTEAHVCVLQTVLDLADQGKEVFVVADAVSSRAPADRELALARMRASGVNIVSREMVAFEWLERAGTDLFREVNREFLR